MCRTVVECHASESDDNATLTHSSYLKWQGHTLHTYICLQAKEAPWTIGAKSENGMKGTFLCTLFCYFYGYGVLTSPLVSELHKNR